MEARGRGRSVAHHKSEQTRAPSRHAGELACDDLSPADEIGRPHVVKIQSGDGGIAQGVRDVRLLRKAETHFDPMKTCAALDVNQSFLLRGPGRFKNVDRQYDVEFMQSLIRIQIVQDRKSTRLNSSHTVISY